MLSSFRQKINSFSGFLLIILFLYSGVIKLIQYQKFRNELMISPMIPEVFVILLSIMVPLLELVAVGLLISEKAKIVGHYISFSLMLSFTLYLIGLLMFYTNIPCACGGILGGMSYPVHIAFNIFFTLVALAGIYTSDAKPAPMAETAQGEQSA